MDGMHIEIEEAAQGFAAMGSEARLAVLQSLVKAGPEGLAVGEIQARTGMAASTLAHHLRFLASAGLVVQEKEGRTVLNRAAFDRLEALADFILKECCAEQEACCGPEPQKDEAAEASCCEPGCCGSEQENAA